jgi:hypothetical protein
MRPKRQHPQDLLAEPPIGFLSPMVDLELDPSIMQDGPALPRRGFDEFKPFTGAFLLVHPSPCQA